MTEQYNTFLIALLFALLIGVWLLVNALIDIAARRCRRRIGDIWATFRAWRGAEVPPANHLQAPDPTPHSQPGPTSGVPAP